MLTCRVCLNERSRSSICSKCAKLTAEEVMDKLDKENQLKPLKEYRRTNSKDVFVGALNGGASS
jgi:hypothetical protein